MRTFAKKQKPTQETKSTNATKPSRAFSRQSRDASSILQLRRTISNQAVLRLLQANTIEPEDNSVTKSSPRFTHDFSQIPLHSKAQIIQTKTNQEFVGDRINIPAARIIQQPVIMTKELNLPGTNLRITTTYSNRPHSLDKVLSDGTKGTQIPYKDEMENRFGANFKNVQAIMGKDAKNVSDKLGAKAFTYRSKVIFKENPPDKKTVAHELAHVSQQIKPYYSSNNAGYEVSSSYSAAEREAKNISEALVQGKTVQFPKERISPEMIHEREIRPGLEYDVREWLRFPDRRRAAERARIDMEALRGQPNLTVDSVRGNIIAVLRFLGMTQEADRAPQLCSGVRFRLALQQHWINYCHNYEDYIHSHTEEESTLRRSMYRSYMIEIILRRTEYPGEEVVGDTLRVSQIDIVPNRRVPLPQPERPSLDRDLIERAKNERHFTERQRQLVRLWNGGNGRLDGRFLGVGSINWAANYGHEAHGSVPADRLTNAMINRRTIAGNVSRRLDSAFRSNDYDHCKRIIRDIDRDVDRSIGRFNHHQANAGEGGASLANPASLVTLKRWLVARISDPNSVYGIFFEGTLQ